MQFTGNDIIGLGMKNSATHKAAETVSSHFKVTRPER